jgi:hypothetical protein
MGELRRSVGSYSHVDTLTQVTCFSSFRLRLSNTSTKTANGD